MKVKKKKLSGNKSTPAGAQAVKLGPDGQPKRGRGRPRKNPVPETAAQVKLGPDGQPKRGRGRPRKNPVEGQISAPTPVVRTITPPMPVTVEREVAKKLKPKASGPVSRAAKVVKTRVKQGKAMTKAGSVGSSGPQKLPRLIGPKTVRSLQGKTLLQLQSKKRMNSLYVVNMLPNHNVMVEVGEGAFILPDSWLPYDLSTHAEPSAYLKSPSFRALLSPTPKRGPLLKVIDAETALAIIESQDGQAEQGRLQMVERGIQPTTRQANTNVIKKELKDLMKEVDSGRIKPRSAAAVLVNLVTNEAEKAYVLRRSTNSAITTAIRSLKLSGARATVRGDDTSE
jgi:hypothetical protein